MILRFMCVFQHMSKKNTSLNDFQKLNSKIAFKPILGEVLSIVNVH